MKIDDFKMPWGKFRGKYIYGLPSSYLKWLAANCDDDNIAEAADQEWNFREHYNYHFEDDETENFKLKD